MIDLAKAILMHQLNDDEKRVNEVVHKVLSQVDFETW